MASYQHISHGFEPVFDQHSRVLVLGSFPSVLSRKNDFYYGNPQNRFWRVMATALGWGQEPSREDAIHIPQTIDEKTRMLLEGGIALWDVIAECDIKGSSDASIKNVVPTQVKRITETARIEAVICNGATAGRLYKRYLQWQTGIEARVLPSTSPANAAWSAERLTERWAMELHEIFDALPEVSQAPGGEAGDKQESERKSERASKGSPASERVKIVSKRGEYESTNTSAGDTAKREGDPAPEGSPASSKAPRTDYAIVRTAPEASNWAVHKSMQGNKRKDTKPELLVRQRLREAGLGGYRLQWQVPGRPDIAWPGKKVCIFVNGCFWHRCPKCHPSTPKKNIDYWEAKFARNVERDAQNTAQLTAAGWIVHVVWECELKKKTREETFASLLPKLSNELGKPLKSKPAGNPEAQNQQS